jgi:hypothetical protein
LCGVRCVAVILLLASCAHTARRPPPFERLRALVGAGWNATDERGAHRAEFVMSDDGCCVVQKLDWWAAFWAKDGALYVGVDANAGGKQELRAPIADDQAVLFVFRPAQPVSNERWAAEMTLAMPDTDHLVETWRYRDGKVFTLRFTRR